MLSTFWTTGTWRLGGFLADLLGNTERSLLKRPQKVMICDFEDWWLQSVLCVSVFQGSLLFSSLALKFSLSAYWNMASLDSQNEIVPLELPNPEKPQIWEGENICRKDSLDPMVTVWLTSKKIPKSWNVFDHVGRVLSETAVTTSILERMLLGATLQVNLILFLAS